jgi:hypothetical protein
MRSPSPSTPTKELWFLRNPKIEESFLAMAIMGIVVIQNVTMLPVWTTVLATVNRATGITSYPVIFTAVFAVGVSIPVALLALAAKVASFRNLEGTAKNFARFGYAWIPLALIPSTVLIVVLGALNVVMFMYPMAHRM